MISVKVTKTCTLCDHHKQRIYLTFIITPGLGPFFLSIIIKSFGRRRAFNLSLMGWVIGGIICLGMIFTVSKDEDKIQKHIRVKMGAEEEETR